MFLINATTSPDCVDIGPSPSSLTQLLADNGLLRLDPFGAGSRKHGALLLERGSHQEHFLPLYIT